MTWKKLIYPDVRTGFIPATAMRYFFMTKLFFIYPFSKAVTQVENTVDAAIDEARKSPGARSTLEAELRNLRHASEKVERALAKIGRENASGRSAGV